MNPNDPPNPPDVTVESVLGAQVGNPPIIPMEEEGTPQEGEPEPPEGALISEVTPQPPPPPTQA